MNSQENRPIYERIKRERTRLGISQAQFALRTGVSKTSQVNYENGIHVPDLKYMAAATSAGVDPINVLLGYSSAKYAAEHFNWRLAAEIFTLIEDWSALRSIAPSMDVKWRLLQLLYTQHCEKGTVDKASVVELLRLAS